MERAQVKIANDATEQAYNDGWYDAVTMVLAEITKIENGYNNGLLEELKQRIV